MPSRPGSNVVYDQAAAAIDAGRLGHGLLFCGPAQTGQARGGRAAGATPAVHGAARRWRALRRLPRLPAVRRRHASGLPVGVVHPEQGRHPAAHRDRHRAGAPVVRTDGVDAAVRRRADRDHRPGRCDQPCRQQCAAEDAGGAGAGALPVAGQRPPGAVVGHHPQPLPAARVPPAATRRGACLAEVAPACRRGRAAKRSTPRAAIPAWPISGCRTMGSRSAARSAATSPSWRAARSARSRPRSAGPPTSTHRCACAMPPTWPWPKPRA